MKMNYCKTYEICNILRVNFHLTKNTYLYKIRLIYYHTHFLDRGYYNAIKVSSKVIHQLLGLVKSVEPGASGI